MDKPSFLIRNAMTGDFFDLYRLARYLDSYNLPADKRRLRSLIKDSLQSFAGKTRSSARTRFLFVLEDLSQRRVVGCSLIIAKHGTPGLPHLYMDSFVERRRSLTLRRVVEHKSLLLGYTEDGPTEVGGLVLLPSYRGRAEKLGHWLSYVRFLYMAAHRDRFEKEVLVEFLPTFLEKKRSPFWEFLGKRFTGLSYREADLLSIDNKEFILSLFPRGVLYQDLFPKEVTKYLGLVGDPTRPAARILEKIGFRYLHQIEPFDGGPYYGARTSEISLVRQARRRRVSVHPFVSGPLHLLILEKGGNIRALAAPARKGKMRIAVDASSAAVLNLRSGEPAWFIAMP